MAVWENDSCFKSTLDDLKFKWRDYGSFSAGVWNFIDSPAQLSPMMDILLVERCPSLQSVYTPKPVALK